MAKDEVQDRELEEDDDGAGARPLRPFWSGTISFGLVSVPVDLYPANRPKRVSLRLLSPEGVPLARRYYDPTTEREVGRERIVRGFEHPSGEMIVVTDEELEALEPEKTRDIDLRRFVPAADIDPRYFQRGYFLAPAQGSNKAYRLLAAVMEQTERAGIATFVMRGREYLVAIFAENGILRAETLRFADELRSAQDVGLPAPAKPKPAAVKTYARAIGKLKKAALSERELRDAWADRLLKLVARKAKKGEDTVELPAEVAADTTDRDIIDLMAVLKQSLEGAKARGAQRAGGAGAASRSSGARARGAARAGRAGRGGDDDDLAALSKDALYARAQALDIEGRSGMTKAELVRALERA